MPPDASSVDTSSRKPFFEICCDATFGDVRTILRQLDMRLAAHGVTEDNRSSVQLALAEAMNNIVEHAYIDQDASGTLTLAIAAADTGLHITLSDTGAAMPWETINRRSSSRRPLTPEYAREGGYGWAIIKKLVADLEYERLDGMNQLRFHVDAPNINARPDGERRRDAYLFDMDGSGGT